MGGIYLLGVQPGTIVSLGRAEPHISFTFERNVVLTRDQPVFQGGYGAGWETRHIQSDYNLYWSVTGQPIFADWPAGTSLSWDAWQARDDDRNSQIADPLCKDPENGDFTMAPDSPVFTLGFIPIDLSDVGPRPKSEGNVVQ